MVQFVIEASLHEEEENIAEIDLVATPIRQRSIQTQEMLMMSYLK